MKTILKTAKSLVISCLLSLLLISPVKAGGLFRPGYDLDKQIEHLTRNLPPESREKAKDDWGTATAETLNFFVPLVYLGACLEDAALNGDKSTAISSGKFITEMSKQANDAYFIPRFGHPYELILVQLYSAPMIDLTELALKQMTSDISAEFGKHNSDPVGTVCKAAVMTIADWTTEHIPAAKKGSN